MEKTRFNIPWLGSVLASEDTDAYSVNCGSRCSTKSFGRVMSASTIKRASPTASRLASSRFSEYVLFHLTFSFRSIVDLSTGRIEVAISTVLSVHLSATRIILVGWMVC